MRIEKINDNQIRCTLTNEDLQERDLRITELAYGTEKAKGLFRDMVAQAAFQFGFEAENTPLMIEAIPDYPGSLVLLITKVEDTQETNPLKSTVVGNPADNQSSEIKFDNDEKNSSTITINNQGNAIPSNRANIRNNRPVPKKDIIKIYTFDKLDDVMNLSQALLYVYNGKNALYKDEKKNQYILVLHMSYHNKTEFNNICNMISEYGSPLDSTYASDQYYSEHYKPVIKEMALQVLSNI
ncbi:MAG: adaptor protein MecA [Lachnospiraceae bacterium]|nr:adaptor protein MecA [Lachnospiraceae bacterium]